MEAWGHALDLDRRRSLERRITEAVRAEVVVRHQAASRYHLPFHGQAWIRVALNGAALAERLLVQHGGVSELRIPLEGPFLHPGTHTLEITLLEATTTYWLHELRIERLH